MCQSGVVLSPKDLHQPQRPKSVCQVHPCADSLEGVSRPLTLQRLRQYPAVIIPRLDGNCPCQVTANHAQLLINYLDGGGRGLHPNAIRGACLAAIDQGVALLRSADREDSALWLHRLAVRCQRDAMPPELPAPIPRAALAPETVAEAMLSAVPGISTVTARALLAEFGSLTAVAGASPDALLAVSGIGKERARALVEALGRPD